MPNELAEKIAGEITLSEQPGRTIKKWREIFVISQHGLASSLGLSPSVISDYESGRRKSPGIKSIRKIVEALIQHDLNTGGKVARSFKETAPADFIMAIQEYPYAKKASVIVDAIEAEVLSGEEYLDRDIHGFTVIDSLRAITSCGSQEYSQIYGWSTERLLVFTGVKYGRSPMVAIRAHPMKPAIVAYHRPGNIDALALKLAGLEAIMLLRIDMPLGVMEDRLRDVRTSGH